MHALAIPCVGLAFINFYVGGYYLFFYLKRPQIREHLPFALLCLSTGLYAVFSAGLYNSNSLIEGIFWQRLQLDTVFAISIFLIWFTGLFTEQKANRVIRIMIGVFLVIFLATLFASPALTLSTLHPAIKNINVFGLAAVYYEGELGPVFQVELLCALLSYIYLFYLFIRYYRKTRYKPMLLVLASLIIYYFGVVNDSMVASQVYHFVYFGEYAFSFIVIAMAYALLDKFVNLHTAFEEFNYDLEQKVRERTAEIERLNGHLKDIAERDGLTGVYNRRFFNEYFDIEVKRAKNSIEHNARMEVDEENAMNFGMAFIDIDQFKLINDTYGHLAGDSVLKQVIDIIGAHIFTRDVLCRYGGDEFALLLTKTSNLGILQAAEKIRKEIEEHEFVFDKTGTQQHITVSIGLVNFNEVLDKENEEILKLADDRLLRAKSSGKNKIVYSNVA
jgi:diguanylate cyclase (GGDEF)-like protein